MPMLTNWQQYELSALQKALKTVTKVEPIQWSSKIYSKIRDYQEDQFCENVIMKYLKEYLQTASVTTCSGNNVDGWRNKTVYLTEKQQETILAWIQFAIVIGGKFDESEF